MKNSIKILLTLGMAALTSAPLGAASQKILSVDVPKVFENYQAATEARKEFGESWAGVEKELKEMYDGIVKLQEEIATLREKSEDSVLVASAREKLKAEVEDRLQTLHNKEEEFLEFRQNVTRKYAERRNREAIQFTDAIVKATTEVAKSKKADIVINKVQGTIYVDDSLDITQLVIDKLNKGK